MVSVTRVWQLIVLLVDIFARYGSGNLAQFVVEQVPFPAVQMSLVRQR